MAHVVCVPQPGKQEDLSMDLCSFPTALLVMLVAYLLLGRKIRKNADNIAVTTLFSLFGSPKPKSEDKADEEEGSLDFSPTHFKEGVAYPKYRMSWEEAAEQLAGLWQMRRKFSRMSLEAWLKYVATEGEDFWKEKHKQYDQLWKKLEKLVQKEVKG